MVHLGWEIECVVCRRRLIAPTLAEATAVLFEHADVEHTPVGS
jgi:hypothetical protein